MVSAQLIILGIAIIGFFATGGLSKLGKAKDILKNWFWFCTNENYRFCKWYKIKK